ncbi:MAG TPA: SRPBCC family protein [Lacunisphaera sp.]|nr:SRPBCC family protein [Lacunisphaera sp.]
MFLTIVLIIAAVIAAVLLAAVFRAPEFRVVRSTTIAAVPAVVFAQVNDFRLWRGWSPWERIDPALKRDYAGSPAGCGATYAWEGNRDVGTGRMTIVDNREPAHIGIKLEFLKPMPGVCRAEFQFEPQGAATTVTWSMAGTSNFICRVFSLFMSPDKMIGTQFEKGLSQLKVVSEKASRN